MQHFQSKNRHQIEFSSLEDAIENDNAVRCIDTFDVTMQSSCVLLEHNTVSRQGI